MRLSQHYLHITCLLLQFVIASVAPKTKYAHSHRVLESNKGAVKDFLG